MNIFKTAILFIVFNRPNTTNRVFEKIRQAKPPRLYVASDGPREGYEGEKEKVIKTREIATIVDWPCEVKTLFRDKNLGCKNGVSTAITWFFKHEEQGIILEDDCVPHLDFFSFCENLLNYYADDEKVGAITGNNFQNNKWRGSASYYFSKFAHCWGWATWRRAWHHNDTDLKFWPKWRNSKDWLNSMPDKVERRFWQNNFDRVYAGEIDTWDYPWDASRFRKGFVAATPNVNLVSNIGFGEGATHTISKNSQFSNMPTYELGPMVYLEKVERDLLADQWTFDFHYGGKNLRFPYNFINFVYRALRFILNKFKTINVNKIKVKLCL
jgi:hypothetical protein